LSLKRIRARCGYDRAGLGAGVECPECGAVVVSTVAVSGVFGLTRPAGAKKKKKKKKKKKNLVGR